MEEGDREEYGKQFLTAPPQSVSQKMGYAQYGIAYSLVDNVNEGLGLYIDM